MQLRGKRLTVMGLGRHGGGVAAARFAAAEGAEVTVTDTATAEQLRDALAQLASVPIRRYYLGGHDEQDFSRAEVLIVNPAVRLDHPLVAHARACGALVTSEIELFLDRCSARVVGVTGSNGKSTTSAMLAAMLAAEGRRVWLGGNIGRSLLPELHQIAATDAVVLELSSFQLAWLNSHTPLPALALITGCTANHLDWHDTFAAYRSAKQRLLQAEQVVLNSFDPETASWATTAQGRVLPLVDPGELPPLRVPGEHSRINAACAATAARAMGCSRGSIHAALAEFAGLPHRLELIAEVAARRFYNDSMATTPESVVAALAALDRPVWLLAGGKDKGADLQSLAAAVAEEARGACFYGASREKLLTLAAEACGRRGAEVPLHRVETLHEALHWCWQRSRSGEAVVLSPGCSSHDQFRDYRHRAEVFARLVAMLPAQEPLLLPSGS